MDTPFDVASRIPVIAARHLSFTSAPTRGRVEALSQQLRVTFAVEQAIAPLASAQIHSMMELKIMNRPSNREFFNEISRAVTFGMGSILVAPEDVGAARQHIKIEHRRRQDAQLPCVPLDISTCLTSRINSVSEQPRDELWRREITQSVLAGAKLIEFEINFSDGLYSVPGEYSDARQVHGTAEYIPKVQTWIKEAIAKRPPLKQTPVLTRVKITGEWEATDKADIADATLLCVLSQVHEVSFGEWDMQTDSLRLSRFVKSLAGNALRTQCNFEDPNHEYDEGPTDAKERCNAILQAGAASIRVTGSREAEAAAHQLSFYEQVDIRWRSRSPVSIPRQKDFVSEWSSYCDSKSLFVLFQSIHAPYDFLHRALSLLDAVLHHTFPHFLLVPRGSVAKRTAIRFGADLDLDLILPRTYNPNVRHNYGPKWSFVAASSDASACKWGVSLTQDIAFLLQRDASGNCFHFTKGIHEMTRSISTLFVVDGEAIELDLFPKLVDDTGSIVAISKTTQLDGSGRSWIATSLSSVRSALMQSRRAHTESALNEEQQAAVLFLKYWKFSIKNLDLSWELRPAMELLKGYHLVVAMEAVGREHAELSAKALQDGNFSDERIFTWMLHLLQFLAEAYQSQNAHNPRFHLIGGTNPFFGDLVYPSNMRRTEVDSKRISDALLEMLADFKALPCNVQFLGTPPAPSLSLWQRIQRVGAFLRFW